MPQIGDLSYGMSVGPGESLRVKADGSAWEHFQPIGMNEIMRIMIAGAQQVGAFAGMASSTTTGGTMTSYLTSDGTAGGTALFTEVLGAFVEVVDSTGVYGKSYAISSDKKTCTVTVTKQAFSGVTILGIGVLGSVSMGAAPNGTVVNLIVIGK